MEVIGLIAVAFLCILSLIFITLSVGPIIHSQIVSWMDRKEEFLKIREKTFKFNSEMDELRRNLQKKNFMVKNGLEPLDEINENEKENTISEFQNNSLNNDNNNEDVTTEEVPETDTAFSTIEPIGDCNVEFIEESFINGIESTQEDLTSTALLNDVTSFAGNDTFENSTDTSPTIENNIEFQSNEEFKINNRVDMKPLNNNNNSGKHNSKRLRARRSR